MGWAFRLSAICENLRNLRTTLAVSSALLVLGARAWGAPSHNLRLPKNRDHFFAENNLTYSRYLSLARDGTYRQINQDRAATVEADQGTWDQDTRTTLVSLHSTLRGLRFRALLSGPLTLTLDEAAKLDALPDLAAAIRRLLADSQAAVFAASDAAELRAPPAAVAMDGRAESFSRENLSGLLAQIEQTIRTEDTRTYQLKPLRLPGRPLLLVLQGAVFGSDRAARTCLEYQVPPGEAPPFYFAETESKEWTRRVGVWRELHLPGGPAGP